MADHTSSALARLGYKVLKNFDFVMVGLCLTFAVSSRPFLTSFETDRVAAAHAAYAEIAPKAQAYVDAREAANPRKDTIDVNLYLYDRMHESKEVRDLSYDFRSARAQLRQAQSSHDLASTFGYVFGGTFAAMGVAFGAIGIRDRKRKGMTPD